MAEKLDSQPRAVRRALYQPGNIRHDEFFAVTLAHPEIGRKRGEVIIGDLRPRLGHFGKQRGLAHVGKSHQPDVRNGFQFQNHFARLRLFARLGKMRRMAPAGNETRVALAPAAADEHGLFLPVLKNIRNDVSALFVLYHRAEGHFEKKSFAVLAEAVFRAAPLAVFDERHVAAPAAVAAVGPAVHHALEMKKRGDAVAAVAGLDRQ